MNAGKNRGHWSGKLAFVLAAAGSAVGLGNIWKFPYLTGTSGGGAFVFVYLLAIFLIGIPIMIAEIYIGQKSQTNAISAFSVLSKKPTFWALPGWLGVLSAFLILSFYSVVGGWVLDYLWNTIRGGPMGIVEGTSFGDLIKDPVKQIIWHAVFIGLTTAIVCRGVKDGIEKWSRILMPALFGIVIVLFFLCVRLEGFNQALTFLFMPDFEKFTLDSTFSALGQAFFTLSIGMGAMITYGSYLSSGESIPKIAFQVAIADTFVALVSGIIVFSVVFSFPGMDPMGGPGLVFSTLPKLFSELPGGYLFSLAFFLLLAFAALTSAISLMEVFIAYVDDATRFSRAKIALAGGFILFLGGIPSILSLDSWSQFTIFGKNIFDAIDNLTSNIFMPVGGILIAAFFGYKLSKSAVKDIFPNNPNGIQSKALLISLRIIAPIGVGLILLAEPIKSLASNFFGG